MMKRSAMTALTSALLALVSGRATAAVGIPLDKTPAKVQTSVKKELPQAKPADLQIREHLRANGKRVFEIDFEAGAVDVELEVAEGGAVKRRRDRIPLAAVPKPVMDTSSRERKEKTGVRVGYGVKIVEKDETFFELHFDNPEGKLKLRYEPDGSLIRRTQELKIAALPKPVGDTARRELGAVAPDKAARVTKSDGVSFRVEGGAGPTEIELKIAADGKLLEREGPGLNQKATGDTKQGTGAGNNTVAPAPSPAGAAPLPVRPPAAPAKR